MVAHLVTAGPATFATESNFSLLSKSSRLALVRTTFDIILHTIKFYDFFFPSCNAVPWLTGAQPCYARKIKPDTLRL